MVDLPVEAVPEQPAGPESAGMPAPAMASLPGAVIAVDLESRVVHWSAGAQALYGWTSDEALGRSVRELIGLSPARADDVLATTHGGGRWEGEFETTRKDGTRLLVYVSNGPVRDEAGEVVGVVGVSLDITAYAAARAARAEELEATSLRAARLADRNARLVRVSEALGAAVTAQEVAEVVLAQAVDALRLDAGGVAVVEGERLHVLASVGYEPHVVRTYEQLPLDARTPLTDLVRARRPMRTERREELLARYPELPHSALSESFAGVPLEVEGRALGVLALSSTRTAAFPDEDVDFLLTLGRQCGQALQRLGLLAAEREARRRATFLAMASQRLSGSLNVHATLDAVADLAVPATGDWCSVHLLDEEGAPELVTLHHRDPARQELLAEVLRRYPLDLHGHAGMGLVITTERTLRLRRFGDDVMGAIARDGWHLDALRRLGIGSALGVPLVAHGRVLGVLTVASDRPDAYGDDEVQLVEDLGHRISTAVDNALRYRQERTNALALQRSLLPPGLPALPGLGVAHRYLPGTAGAEVGGDWYDVLPLQGGRVGLVIGDVMGRGIAAAAVMGQLRAAVRACALVEDSPSAVLALVDAAMSSLGQTSLTTCLYAVYDPSSRRLRVASAGHLPPLLVHAGGGEYVELDPGPPLGVAAAPPPEVAIDVPEGALLLLYTDGLVEGRAQPVEEGMLALRNAVAELPTAGDLDALCDGLLVALGRDGRPDDDIALLAVCTGGGAAPEADAHLHLAGHLSEVARARRLVVARAAAAGCDTDDAALLVTELATNALRHGGPGVDLWVRPADGGGLRVEIVDGRADATPTVRHPAADAEGGRGLQIVGALARAWGSERLSAGKRVWFELGPAVA